MSDCKNNGSFASIIAKQWSITQMTVLTIVGLIVLGAGMVFHADSMSLGIVVTMTGMGVQLIRSHYAQEEQTRTVIDTANALAEKTLTTARELADKTLERAHELAEKKIQDMERLMIETGKNRSVMVAVARSQEQLKESVAEQANGGRTVDIIQAVAEAIKPNPNPESSALPLQCNIVPTHDNPVPVTVVPTPDNPLPVIETKKDKKP